MENIHQGEGHSATHRRCFVMTQIAPSAVQVVHLESPRFNIVFFTS